MKSHMTQKQINLRSRQLNPCDLRFWQSRGYTERPANWEEILTELNHKKHKKRTRTTNRDLRSRQLNACDILYWKSRGYTERPINWQDLIAERKPDVETKKKILRSRQLNPYDQLYWKSRGYSERPCNWKDILEGKSGFARSSITKLSCDYATLLKIGIGRTPDDDEYYSEDEYYSKDQYYSEDEHYSADEYYSAASNEY